MIKVFEMFSGYGGASFGLKKANIHFECVGISEVNKYAIQCYKLAGNGWDINLVSKIFKRMFKDTPPIISSGDLRNE